jgi:hypothetical protein
MKVVNLSSGTINCVVLYSGVMSIVLLRITIFHVVLFPGCIPGIVVCI